MKTRVTEAVSDDGREALRVEVLDGDKVIHKLEFVDGESEDNSLGRNFNDCHSISKVIGELLGSEPECNRVSWSVFCTGE